MAKKTESAQEEVPLHEIVLKHMFEANKEKPAKLSVSDIFWKVGDPSVSESQIGDVLKWLVHKRRVEIYAGNYSLDRFEFLDQRNDDTVEVVKKKQPTKPKPVLKPSSNTTKPLSEVPSETAKMAPKVLARPVQKATSKKEKVGEIPNTKKSIKPEDKVEKRDWVNTVLLIAAISFFCYGFALLLPNDNFTESEASNKEQEISSVLIKLGQLSERQEEGTDRVKTMEERLNLFQEIAVLRSEQLIKKNQTARASNNLEGIVRKLIFSNSIILLILLVVVYRRS